MAKVLDINYLRSRVLYDPSTGALTWLPITKDMIKPDSKRPIDVAVRIWNTRYAGKPAFTQTDGRRYWGKMAGGGVLLAHRVAWALYYGEWPQQEIDHIDGNGQNNSIANLRDVTKSENMRNAKLNNLSKSRVTGVIRRNKKWFAYIHSGGKQVSIGTFDTKSEAVSARKNAERLYGYHPNHGRAS